MSSGTFALFLGAGLRAAPIKPGQGGAGSVLAPGAGKRTMAQAGKARRAGAPHP